MCKTLCKKRLENHPIKQDHVLPTGHSKIARSDRFCKHIGGCRPLRREEWPQAVRFRLGCFGNGAPYQNPVETISAAGLLRLLLSDHTALKGAHHPVWTRWQPGLSGIELRGLPASDLKGRRFRSAPISVCPALLLVASFTEAN